MSRFVLEVLVSLTSPTCVRGSESPLPHLVYKKFIGSTTGTNVLDPGNEWTTELKIFLSLSRLPEGLILTVCVFFV